MAYLSKKLAEIWLDAPIKLNLKEVDGSKSNPEEIQKILKDLEFRSLLARLPEVFKMQDNFVATTQTQLKVAKNIIIDSDESTRRYKT